VVNYINTLPLIDGLSGLRDVSLQRHVPAQLAALLESGRVDVALCSAFDYQVSKIALQVVPVGMLGCCGSTHTVRLYSRVPLGQVSTLACDLESHTSRALAQLVLGRHGSKAAVMDYDRSTGPRCPDADAMLLIGDKVVNDAPAPGEWAHELDLGQAWHEWTGLPFVFAVWMTREDLTADQRARVRVVARVLDHQRRHNQERLGGIVARECASHGWPAELARDYLGNMLRFDFTPQARSGLERFFAECSAAGILSDVRPLKCLEW
jgi:chorismate dehydratase